MTDRLTCQKLLFGRGKFKYFINKIIMQKVSSEILGIKIIQCLTGNNQGASCLITAKIACSQQKGLRYFLTADSYLRFAFGFVRFAFSFSLECISGIKSFYHFHVSMEDYQE